MDVNEALERGKRYRDKREWMRVNKYHGVIEVDEVALAVLAAEVERLRKLIRCEQIEPPFDVADDCTTQLAVELAAEKNRIAKLESELATERQYRISDNDDIARWQERVRMLTEALRPFAEAWSKMQAAGDDKILGDGLVECDYRAAAAALEGK